MPIRETARAKINLTLEVHGKRPDGYHALTSLVTFAEVGDAVVFDADAQEQVTISGRFAPEILGENLLSKALATLRAETPGLRLGAVHLEKHLPVAAGIGGGSADVGALLRAVRDANMDHARAVDWHGIAGRLGADVPVCFANAPAMMHGKGDQLVPVARLPSVAAVLVNPRRPLETAEVFAALAAQPLAGEPPQELAPDIVDLDGLCTYMRARNNALKGPALRLMPAIGDIKAALDAQPGCRITAMSGSGPTCFGLFSSSAAANQAARALAASQASWWVVATELAGAG